MIKISHAHTQGGLARVTSFARETSRRSFPRMIIVDCEGQDTRISHSKQTQLSSNMSEQIRSGSRRDPDDDWDAVYVQQDDPTPSQDSEDRFRQGAQDVFRDEEDDDDDDDEEGFDMSVAELLYSTSSFYAIAIPGTDGNCSLSFCIIHSFRRHGTHFCRF